MTQTKITIRDNGPLLITCPVELVDAEGKPLPIPAEKAAIALCRCGASANKPFCDGAHRAAGFNSTVRAPQ